MADQSKKCLMEQIMECEFILIDINLFLDTHPNDKRAIDDYNAYAEQLEILKKKYVARYGPIHNFGNSKAIGEDCFSWVTQSFPWMSCK